MSNIPAIVKAARAMLSEQTSANWSDPDSLSDSQLLALAGPGYPDFESWSDHGLLPATVPGLLLLGNIIEHTANAAIALRYKHLTDAELLAMAGMEHL